LIASIAYQDGELAGSPLPRVPGHLLVVCGFEERGHVVTCDPAARTDEEVGIVYDRLQFEHCWLRASNGTVYVVHPPGWNVPRV
jgi:hypothetical protein